MKKKPLIIIGLMMVVAISLIIVGKKANQYIRYNEDTYLAISVNGTATTNIPAKGNYEVKLTCDGGTGKWDYDNWEAVIFNIVDTARCSLSFKSITPTNFATYIKGLNNAAGVYNEPATDWRYEGKDPNNWLLFNGEMWRIIGVFDDSTHEQTAQSLVKIIRAESIGGLVWSKVANLNEWPSQSLYTLLNTNYYNGINEVTLTNCYGYSATIPGNCNFDVSGITSATYRNMIENVTWKLGGKTGEPNVQDFYEAERGTEVYSGRSTTVVAPIGLMYPSDYGYSVLASSCARTTTLASASYNAYGTANCAGQSWLYGNAYEWTLTPETSAGLIYYIDYTGKLNDYLGNNTMGYSVRPTLYLKSDVMKLTGNGSKETPYIITR